MMSIHNAMRERIQAFAAQEERERKGIPFTPQEEWIMECLVEAHNSFTELTREHPQEITEWITAVHHLQDLLGARALRRIYPQYFTSPKPPMT